MRKDLPFFLVAEVAMMTEVGGSRWLSRYSSADEVSVSQRSYGHHQSEAEAGRALIHCSNVIAIRYGH